MRLCYGRQLTSARAHLQVRGRVLSLANETGHWEILNAYDVPFNRLGMIFLPDDANDSESEPDYRQEEMDDYNAMVMDNVRDAESRAQW